MKKIILLTLAVLTLSTSLSAEDKAKKEKFVPKAGDFSFGITFNPMAVAGKSFQPAKGDFVGNYINSYGTEAKQMWVLGTEPLASLMVKYRMSEIMSLRANLGFTGSSINYKEYVDDDKADALSNAKVVDVIHNKQNNVSLALALELHKVFGSFQFNAGIGLIYGVGGGRITYTYGNPLTPLEGVWRRTTMPYLQQVAPGTDGLNQWTAANGIAAAYPTESYNQGYVQGLGLCLDMGLEWFCLPRVSVALSMTLTPVMAVFQPQTYTVYEGYSTYKDSLDTFNKLVSPGSNAVLYGTESLGFRLSLNYYL